MISTILHVEDDLVLRGLVALAFENFGFRGTIVPVGTVKAAIKRLDESTQGAGAFDLVISDMHLPDGSGLDIVRYLRSTRAWMFTPVLILSGDVDPKKVGRAYALGANAYVDKSPAGRSLSEVLRSLYHHWLKDAVVPPPHEPTPTQQVVQQAIDIRARQARFYQRIAESFGDNESESAFWLSRALAESNLANLLAFVRRTLEGQAETGVAIREIEAMQARSDHALSVAEQQLDRGPLTQLDAYRLVINILSMIDLQAISTSIAYLFPIMPVAMEALRDFLIGTVNDITAWIDLHSNDPILREQTSQLRTDAVILSEHAEPPVAHATW